MSNLTQRAIQIAKDYAAKAEQLASSRKSSDGDRVNRVNDAGDFAQHETESPDRSEADGLAQRARENLQKEYGNLMKNANGLDWDACEKRMVDFVRAELEGLKQMATEYYGPEAHEITEEIRERQR